MDEVDLDELVEADDDALFEAFKESLGDPEGAGLATVMPTRYLSVTVDYLERRAAFLRKILVKRAES